jgi:DUF1680 family protein
MRSAYVLLFFCVLVQFPQCHKPAVNNSVPVFQSIDPQQVKIDGEIGRRIDLVSHVNIPKIDFENTFLKHYREKSPDPAVRDGFVGLGMLLDAIVGLAYYTREQEMIDRKSYLVEELIKTQVADGYIGIFSEEKRQTGWDTHEGAYIILALTNDFICFNDEESLEAAIKYADYLIDREVTIIAGLDQAFLRLYDATKNQKYLEYCKNEFGLPDFKFARIQQSRHVYGHLDRALMQLKLNEIEPDEQLLYKPHVAVEFLVNMDALDIIGGSGMWEHFNTSHQGQSGTDESCATAFIIWLMDALLKTEGNSFYGDIMERSIYNALFAALSPTGDSIRYFTDYESAKEYYPADYFCCPNNFRRIMADLPELVYYRSEEGIAVNLYNNSQVTFNLKEQEVRLMQDTDYPSSENVLISVETGSPIDFEMKLRIPLWCKAPSIQINGEEPEIKAETGSFYTITRKWVDGDKIQLTFPMNYRFIQGRGNQWQKVALMRGPVVYGISNQLNPSVTEGRDLHIDPSSIGFPETDDSYRPGGMTCTAKVFEEDSFEITFTEFIDPTGIKTFFYLSESSSLVEDDEFVAKLY